MINNKIVNIYLKQLEIPSRKIRYLLNSAFEILVGCYGVIERYGFSRRDIITYNSFVEALTIALTEGDTVEYEFTAKESETLEEIKKYQVEGE